jgi:protein arginine phosphatase
VSVKRFLFVCTGNSCRSVMAEKLLNKLARDKGLSWEALSCGTSATRALGVPSGVKKALAGHGVEVVSHMSRAATENLLEWADVVLAMSTEHVEILNQRFPTKKEKIQLFRGHLGLPRPDVADPIGKPDREYELCCKDLREGVEALIQKYGQS